MADIKFMDLSQNDNPATTDSVLIGNKDNGLKRTTLGKLGDMFAVKGLFHFETIQSQIDTTPDEQGKQNNKISVTAPDVQGYTFMFWLNPSSIGDTRNSYVEKQIAKTSNVWIDLKADNTANQFTIQTVAVYVKNSVL